MLLLISSKADSKTLQKVAENLNGYIKVVVDIKKEILVAGGEMHVEGEQLMLKNGSEQEDLWGGGLDLETGEVDFNSMINIRPKQDNFSRDVSDNDIRTKIEKIIRRFLV